MRQIKLTIEYDGTNYAGWQTQPNGLAVQQVLEEALERFLGERVVLRSSGRTDAGVHAKGMVACFRTGRSLPESAYTDGLNCILPPDIAVVGAGEVPLHFNPRHDAKGKHYRYTLLCSRRRSPMNRLYAWHLRDRPDLELMRTAAGYFLGEHDFSSFRTSGCAATSTVKRIDSVTISARADFIRIDVVGSGFMRNMVRIMVGTLVQVGLGKMQPEDVRRCLAEPGRKAGPNAPPHGLCLMEVFY